MRLANVDGRPALVGPDGRICAGPFAFSMASVYQRWDEFTELAQGQERVDKTLPPHRLGPPSPEPSQVFAVALNYSPHAAEAGFQAPADPLVFTKFPACLTGPDATVPLPSEKVDWEVELVAVIGRGGHRIPAERAWDHVAGLTVGQDLSERHVQMLGTPPQFSLAKSFPGFGPTGPVLVTPDELDDPGDLEIMCLLNGTVMQRARTKDMIFPLPELIARISAICPLRPGDLIFTGTPAGVGSRMNPPRYLRPGDELVSRIEGVGELRTAFSRPD